jgi:hypothetical protein
MMTLNDQEEIRAFLRDKKGTTRENPKDEGEDMLRGRLTDFTLQQYIG